MSVNSVELNLNKTGNIYYTIKLILIKQSHTRGQIFLIIGYFDRKANNRQKYVNKTIKKEELQSYIINQNRRKQTMSKLYLQEILQPVLFNIKIHFHLLALQHVHNYNLLSAILRRPHTKRTAMFVFDQSNYVMVMVINTKRPHNS